MMTYGDGKPRQLSSEKRAYRMAPMKHRVSVRLKIRSSDLGYALKKIECHLLERGDKLIKKAESCG